MKSPAPKSSSHLIGIVIIIIIIVVLYYYSKAKGWFAPSTTASLGIGPAGAPQPNTLTQASYVKQFPRSDGKGTVWQVSVPNIPYADRFQPGATWTKNSDGSAWARQGNYQVQTSAGFTPTGGTTFNFQQAVLKLNPFYSKTAQPNQQNGITTAAGSSTGYVDADWDYGMVRGDYDASGNPTEAWSTTPKAMAMALMGENLAMAQQAYDDYGQYWTAGGIWPATAVNTKAEDDANIAAIYGAALPGWTQGLSGFTNILSSKPKTPEPTTLQKTAPQYVNSAPAGQPGNLAITTMHG